ncbi:MAG: DUF1648 domain-containing protein [Thermoplasmataceae archaeon]
MVGPSALEVMEMLLVATIGIMLSIIPYVTEKSIIFGVRTPAEFRSISQVRKAQRTYLIAVLLITAMSEVLIFTIVYRYYLLLAIYPLFIVLGAFFIYLPEHYAIARRKRDERWVEQANQAITAQFVTAEEAQFPWVYAVPGLLVLIAIFVIGILYYPSIPSTFPTHFGSNGIPDQYSAKSIGSVFLVGFISIATTALMLIIACAISRTSFRVDDSSRQSMERGEIFRYRMTAMLLLIPAFINTTLLLSSLQIWGIFRSGNYMIPLILAPVFAMLVLVVVVTYLTGQLGSNIRKPGNLSASGNTSGMKQESMKDDDLYWRGGVVYVNRKDPRWLVPKRFGVGYTLNFGHPGTMVLLVLPFVIILNTFAFIPKTTSICSSF